ncbi:hypothetical protein PGT21_032641 [Puccinia graminis f. sp. tritici]|uniref:Uncharacterized protein n=1 Tax=Puccinia graminis f. sp. tritici TaxID=56615 RepID=A0A5B0QPN3_PUCGR|nr:hypothetical protein PGT21_032641 [Puccinia graminis f. sp. tritici]
MIHPDLAGQTEAAINTQPPPLSDDETDKSSESEESAQDDHSSPAEGGDESANLPSASSLTSRVNETPSMIASLQTTLGLSDTVVETVQQWASMTPQEHLVGITMYLESMNQQIQRLAPQSSVQDVPAPAPPAPAAPRAHVWHRDFRAFIRTELRACLLRPDLMSYGRTHTVRTRALNTRTPLLLVKVRPIPKPVIKPAELTTIRPQQHTIDNMAQDWKAVYLPAGYLNHNHDDIRRLNELIRELLKYEKSAFAKLIMTGARPGRRSSNDAVPTLDGVIIKILQKMSPEHEMMNRGDILSSIKSPMRVRIGFLRLHMYVQRQQDRTTTHVRSPWEVIDRHLENLRRESRDYKTAFARLVLAFNRHLFDGTKSATDIAKIVVSLPSPEEVQEALDTGAQMASPEDKAQDGADGTAITSVPTKIDQTGQA